MNIVKALAIREAYDQFKVKAECGLGRGITSIKYIELIIFYHITLHFYYIIILTSIVVATLQILPCLIYCCYSDRVCR